MANDVNLNNIPDSCDKLSKIADEARNKLITLNIYQNQSGKKYSAQHPNATQKQGGIDDVNNVKGKGTGVFLDTSNGGGKLDIEGRVDVIGSGRKRLLMLNKYTQDKKYECNIQ